MPASFRLLQIAYSPETTAPISPDFVILDNLANPKPEWYELWPMLEYLNSNTLDEDCWLGFFSPKFTQKTGWSGANIKDFILRQSATLDVALFSQAWDQIAYFKNVFEQGEAWHPGLKELAAEVMKEIGISIDLEKLVNHSENACFSNFIVAKPRYWRVWQLYAQRLFDLIEYGTKPVSRSGRTLVAYGHPERQAPIRTFVQERLHSLILPSEQFEVVSYERAREQDPFERLFQNNRTQRLKLEACDSLKRLHTVTGKSEYLNQYIQIAATINFTRPY
jgi:hypothetical protein